LINLESDEWYSAAASTVKEACDMVKAGFEYVFDFNGINL